MIILRSPKGWTGPKEVDGKPTEGTWRSHQVPLADVRDNPGTWPSSRRGCAATAPTSCSTRPAGPIGRCSPPGAEGRPAHERQPARQRRPVAARPGLPDFRDYAVEVKTPGATSSEATRVLGSSCAM